VSNSADSDARPCPTTQDPDSKLLLKIGLASGHCLDTGEHSRGP
jgi:hypothetical protein